ncbi:MAG: type II secretion system protein J [Oscillospiraceae bacterium]
MKKRLSAFTLIETIIVMAIFSMIMFSVMQLMDPVSKYFVRGSNFENSTACLDNMRRCIEGNLMYADRIRAYAGFEPYIYTEGGVDVDGDGTDDITGVKTSSYAPSPVLKQQVSDFHTTYFKDRVCFDASGVIYVICFDNTEIISDTALQNLSRLSSYNDMRLNQGKILLYGFQYNAEKDGSGEVVYTLDLDNPTITEWTVNQKLYGNFDYTFYLGTDGKKDDGSGNQVLITDATELLGKYNMIFTDCKIHISVTEVRRGASGGLERSGTAASYQNTYASFILENALQYGETAFTNIPQMDTKILYDRTKDYKDITAYKRISIDQVQQLGKMGDSSLTTYNTIAAASQTGPVSSFYFIFTTPDSCNNVDPLTWGITVS